MSIFQLRAVRAIRAVLTRPLYFCPAARGLITALAALALSGCVNLAAIAKYDIQSDRGGITDEHGSWVIRDRAFENLLMIRPSLDRALGNSFVDGATLWTTDINAQNYPAEAVIAWFAQEGRACHTIDGRRVGVTEWEFKYQCKS